MALAKPARRHSGQALVGLVFDMALVLVALRVRAGVRRAALAVRLAVTRHLSRVRVRVRVEVRVGVGVGVGVRVIGWTPRTTSAASSAVGCVPSQTVLPGTPPCLGTESCAANCPPRITATPA